MGRAAAERGVIGRWRDGESDGGLQIRKQKINGMRSLTYHNVKQMDEYNTLNLKRTAACPQPYITRRIENLEERSICVVRPPIQSIAAATHNPQIR